MQTWSTDLRHSGVPQSRLTVDSAPPKVSAGKPMPPALTQWVSVVTYPALPKPYKLIIIIYTNDSALLSLHRGCSLWTLTVSSCDFVPHTELTLKWLSRHRLSILLQELFWWWQCSLDRSIIPLFPAPPPYPLSSVPNKPYGSVCAGTWSTLSSFSTSVLPASPQATQWISPA